MARVADLVRVAPAMGTVFSFRVRGARDGGKVDAAVDAAMRELLALEAIFTTFRRDSEVVRLRDGRLDWAAADPLVHEVATACAALEAATRGRFSAYWRGWFDPTGYVKGWAVDRVMAHHLAPLLADGAATGAGVGAGGDILVRNAAPDGEPWGVGIADPSRPGGLAARIEVSDGAIATSGLAERGAHIIDPRTGRAATTVRSATVVGDDLAVADAWATAAVVAGDDLDWIADAPTRSGLVIGAGGVVRRWAGPAELVATDPISSWAA